MALIVPKSLRAMITGALGDRRMPRIRKIRPGVDPKLLIKDAAKLMPDPARRLFLRGGASLGALTFLTGCDIIDSAVGGARAAQDFVLQRPRAGLAVQSQQARADLSGQRDHAAVSVQRLLPRGRSARGRQADYKLEVGGLVDNKKSWTLDELYALPQETQITRHICVEGWSAIGKWTGVRLSRIPAPASAPTRARNTSGSAAPRAIPPPSTWRPRCIRRRR